MSSLFSAQRDSKESCTSRSSASLANCSISGCADGHIADTFSEFDYRHGVDIDPVAIEAAKRRFRDRSNMHFIAADLCTRPFPPAEFDNILFACTIHHLDDESLLRLLKEFVLS